MRTPASADTARLAPDVQPKVSELMDSAAAADVPLSVHETLRSPERQDSLYAIGRQPNDVRPPVTWTRNSAHEMGRAVDFRSNNDASGRDPGYAWLQDMAPRLGFKVLDPALDPGHVELPETAESQALAQRIERIKRLQERGLGDAVGLTPQELMQRRLASSHTPSNQRPSALSIALNMGDLPSEEGVGSASSLRTRALGAGITAAHVPVDIAAGTLGLMKTGAKGLREVVRREEAQLSGQDYAPPAGLHEEGVEALKSLPLMGYQAQSNLMEATGAPGLLDALRGASAREPQSSSAQVRAAAGLAALALLDPARKTGLFERRAGETVGDVARTGAAEPRVHQPLDAPATSVRSTAEAAAGLSHDVAPESAPYHQAEPVSRAAYDAAAPDVVTAPDNPLGTLDDRISALKEEIDGLAQEASALTVLKDKTPEQLARHHEINARLQELGAEHEQLEPPPPLEESAAAPRLTAEEPPLSKDWAQRELDRRRPGDRRLDEVKAWRYDEFKNQRQGERRQPEFSRSGVERRDVESRPVPQGEERRTFTDPEEYEIHESKQAPALYDPGAMEELPTPPRESTRPNAEAEAFPAEGETPGPALSDAEHEALYPQRSSPAEQAALSRLDVSGLDARIEAQRAANARLEAEANAIPLRPKLTPAEKLAAMKATKEKGRAASAAQEAAQGRADQTRSRKALAAERRGVEKRLDAMRAELSDLPRGRTRGSQLEATQDRRATLEQAIADAERQLGDIRTKQARPKDATRIEPPSGPKLSGEGGFLRFGNKLAEPSAAQLAQLPPGTRDVAQRVAVGERAPFKPNVIDTLHQWFWETSRFARTLERRARSAGKELPVSQRPLLWFKAALDSPTRIGGFLFKEGAGPGTWDRKGNWQLTGTPAFETALKPIKGDPVKVTAWRSRLVAARVPEVIAKKLADLQAQMQSLQKQGKLTAAARAKLIAERGHILGGRATGGISLNKAKQALAETLPPEVTDAVEHTQHLLDDALQYGVDAGAYTPDLADALRDTYAHYVPFQRAFEGEGMIRSGGSGAPTAPRGPVKRLVGSELPIVDPAETVPDYVARMVRYADIYRAARSMVDLIEAHPDLFEGLAKLEKSAPLTTVGQATSALGQLLSDKALSLEGDRVQLANSTKGTLETYRVDPIISDALKGLGTKEFGLFVELTAGVFKKSLTFGVTNNPVFGLLINPIRDAMGRPTMSVATKYPFQGSPRAAAHALLERPDFKKFRSMGGGFGLAAESGGGFAQLARAAGGRGRRVASQLAGQAVASKLIGGVTPAKLIGSVPNFFKEISLPAEQAGRFAEFRTVKASGRSIYGDAIMSDLEAHMHTQEALGNFAEHGTASAMRLLAHTGPFFNPTLQGTRAFAAAIRRNPGRVAAYGIATITLPTLALYYLNRNDQDIQDLRQGPGGYLYWFGRTPQGDIIKAPKPFGPGAVFGTAVEHTLDAWYAHDPHAATRGLNDFFREELPNYAPPLAAAAYSFATNKDLGTGTPLVPNEQTGNLPGWQVGRHPSPTMTRLAQSAPGQAVGLNPAHLKYGVRQFAGTMGGEGLNALDRALYGAEMPAMRKADYPFVGRLFGRTPSSAAAPIRDVYSESNRPIAVMTTLDYLANKGQGAELERFVRAHKDELARSEASSAATEVLSYLAEQAELMETIDGLTSQQRADNRDAILRQMVDVARQLHPVLDQMRRDEAIAKPKP